jgi:hypothetical protein
MSFGIVMNKAAYEGLSAAEKKALAGSARPSSITSPR